MKRVLIGKNFLHLLDLSTLSTYLTTYFKSYIKWGLKNVVAPFPVIKITCRIVRTGSRCCPLPTTSDSDIIIR